MVAISSLRSSELPAWITALRDDRALMGELQLRWLDPEQQEATKREWIATWNQIPFGAEFHARCAARLERSRPLAEGSARERTLGHGASSLVVVFDPEEPESLWVSLSHAIPSLAWADAGSSAAALRACLATYTGRERGATIALARSERLVKQLDGKVDLDLIKLYLEKLELWLDDATWGSAHDDDPWREIGPSPSVIELGRLMQHVHDQEPGRFPSISFRTLWSRSILRVEQHPLGLWVFDARYDPAGDARAVARLGGTAPGTGLPSDLPVDVAASLVRNASFTRESIAETEKTQPLEPFDLSVLCALDPGEATTVARLRAAIDAWADDEERFGGLLQLMSAYGYAALLFEAAARLPAGDLRERLLTYLRPDDGDDDPGGASR